MLVVGKRQPAPVRVRKRFSADVAHLVAEGTMTEAAAIKMLAETNRKLAEDHQECKDQLAEWAVSKEMGQELDRRSLSLAGESTWVRSNIEVYSHASVLTSHDWLQLVQ